MSPLLPLVGLLTAGTLLGCNATPVEADSFNQVQVEILDGATTNQRFVDAIAAASTEVLLMLPHIEDTAISDALVDARDRGLLVEVVTDIDEAAGAGVVALQDAGIEVTLADDDVAYFDFSINSDVSWNSGDAIMSNAMLLTDGLRVLNATEAGGVAEGQRIVFTVSSEDLAYDLRAEHNQIHGGTDATTLTAYDSLAKSVADARWRYSTQSDWDLEVWLGPQERLVKRVIDSIYSARKSVYVLTDDLADEGLAVALQAKAETGFDVQVVVGPGFGDSSSALSARLTASEDVTTVQVSDAEVPTLVLIDVEEEGQELLTARGMVVSHDLYSAARLYGTAEIRTDQLIDGNLFVIDDYDEPGDTLNQLKSLWQGYRDAGQEL